MLYISSFAQCQSGKFVYIAHNFIFLPLSLFDLSVDGEGWWFEHSVS